MLVADIVASVVVGGASLAAAAILLRRTPPGICGRCEYDCSGLPAEATKCPECAGDRLRRWWRWRRMFRRRFVILVAAMAVGGAMLAWPRRDAIMERMPSWVLLGAERMGYVKGLEVLAMRAHDGVMMGWSDDAFIDRVTERMTQDSAAVTWPRSNALYVYVQLALVGDEGARTGIRNLIRSGNTRATDDFLRMHSLIRLDVPGEILKEAQSKQLSPQAFRETERGKLYALLHGDPDWLADTMIEMLGEAKSDTEAVGIVMLMRETFRDESVAARAVVKLAAGKWTAAQSAADIWLSMLRGSYQRLGGTIRDFDLDAEAIIPANPGVP